MKFKREHPRKALPHWMLVCLLLKSDSEIRDRMSYLQGLSLNLTVKGKRFNVSMEIHPGITHAGDLKRKLAMSPADDPLHPQQQPRKKQRVFTGTAEELVNLFGQYSQVTTAANVTPFNPMKTMESILHNAEKA